MHCYFVIVPFSARSTYVRSLRTKSFFLFFCPDFCFKKRVACFFSSGILFSSTMFFFLLLFRIVQLSRVIFNLFLCFVLSWFLFWRKVFFPLLFWGFDKSSGRKRFEGGGKDAVVGERGGSFVFWRAIFSNLFFFPIIFCTPVSIYLTIFLVSNGRTMGREFYNFLRLSCPT